MATYYIRFDTDGENIYFNLFEDENAREDRFLASYQCSGKDEPADSHPWVMTDFEELSKEQKARLMDLSDWFELACACWVETMDYGETPTEVFDRWIYEEWIDGMNILHADEYVTQDATADEIAEHAKHYRECFEQVVSESED